jgi:hypothetical protein
MADKLAVLMDDADLRQKMSADSVVGMEHFSAEQLLAQWEELLK